MGFGKYPKVVKINVPVFEGMEKILLYLDEKKRAFESELLRIATPTNLWLCSSYGFVDVDGEGRYFLTSTGKQAVRQLLGGMEIAVR